MKTPNEIRLLIDEAETDKEANRIIEEYGEANRKAGAEQMEQQLEPLITELGMFKARQSKWISVSDQMPPVNVEVFMRAVISWKTDFRISYFNDTMESDYEILEYGISGYILKLNNDFLVVNHPNPEAVCDEYITHWMPLPEPPKQ